MQANFITEYSSFEEHLERLGRVIDVLTFALNDEVLARYTYRDDYYHILGSDVLWDIMAALSATTATQSCLLYLQAFFDERFNQTGKLVNAESFFSEPFFEDKFPIVEISNFDNGNELHQFLLASFDPMNAMIGEIYSAWNLILISEDFSWGLISSLEDRAVLFYEKSLEPIVAPFIPLIRSECHDDQCGDLFDDAQCLDFAEVLSRDEGNFIYLKDGQMP